MNSALPISGLPVPSPAVGAAWLGLNPLWGTLTPSYPFGVNAALFGIPRLSPGFFGTGPAVAPFYGGDFGSGFYGPQYYPPQPAQPPANTTIVFPPQPPVVAPQPVPFPQLIPDDHAPDVPVRPAVAAPAREPVVQQEYPALIAVKNGNLYSAYQYWFKGKTFHFITTNGEHHQIPVDMLERLYPRQKDGIPVDPQTAAPR